jgi:hypothetical protein
MVIAYLNLTNHEVRLNMSAQLRPIAPRKEETTGDT